MKIRIENQFFLHKKNVYLYKYIHSLMSVSKRLKAEERKFFSQYLDYSIEYDKLFHKQSYTQVVIYDKDYQFRFYIPRYYPFKSPLLYINDQEYISQFINFYQKNQLFIKKFLKDYYTCPCCSTLLCQWSPQNNIPDIINEFYQKENERMLVIALIILYPQLVSKNNAPFDDLIYKNIIKYCF